MLLWPGNTDQLKSTCLEFEDLDPSTDSDDEEEEEKEKRDVKTWMHTRASQSLL